MAGLEVDTSSYPKPTAQPSLMDQVQKYQQVESNQNTIQQQRISIDKNKLDLINTQFGLMNSELSNLAATPNITKDEAARRLTTFANTYKFPPEVVSHMMTELQQAPDVKTFAEYSLRRGMDVQQKLNQTYGQPSNVDTGQVIQPGIQQSPMQGGGFTPSGQPIQKRLPVGTPIYDENNQPVFSGEQPLPGARNFPPLPIARPQAANQPEPPATFDNRFSAANPKAGPSPLFEEGKKAYIADQSLAAQKMTAVKPALEALKILPGLRSGPGTEPFNKAVAFLKANNIISTDQENDPTVVYQEANKYLSQYLKGRGGRSDADLAAAEKSSPNVAYQLNPALLKLTRVAIAQDRIEAARANAFEGKNYENYPKHQGSFPQSIDDRAFSLDLQGEEESKKLVDKMYRRYEKNPKDAEAIKFFRSLDIAKKQGFY